MCKLSDLKIKLFADGADKAEMLSLALHPLISGFTTNPTLMRKAGVTDYRQFALDIVKAIPDRPISFEVFADDSVGMDRQARVITSWGPNVYVKIPITNSNGISMCQLIHDLSHRGIKVNITAMMTLNQVREVSTAVAGGASCYVSVFAGRIADTGRDPVPIMAEAVEILRATPHAKLLWASPREVLNIFQADSIGCHVITATGDILKKLSLIGRDLDEYSLDTARMFYHDAEQAGYSL